MLEASTTELEWGDLVLDTPTVDQLLDIEAQIKRRGAIVNDWGMAGRLRPGFRYLFCGPSGTGKTTTALVLGKRVARPVYRVDLSAAVSKFIGETEKNLEAVFSRALKLDGILLIDEAEALFSKRADVKDAHDRYANMEIAYLLQRIEGHRGIVILATNRKGEIDDAFSRRLDAVVLFSMPSAADRKRLWDKALPASLEFDADIDISELAEQYPLSGGAIVNALRYASIVAGAAGRTNIRRVDVIEGIRRELGERRRAELGAWAR